MSAIKKRLQPVSLAHRGGRTVSLAYIQQQVRSHLRCLGESMIFCRNMLLLGAIAVLAFPACAQSSSQFSSLALSSNDSSSHWPIAAERHLQPTSTGALFSNSAFAHGYRHGYDEGFHVGDLDIHMGRSARLIMKAGEFRQPGREYNDAFGSKQLFHEGYQAGFHSGYSDAL